MNYKVPVDLQRNRLTYFDRSKAWKVIPSA